MQACTGTVPEGYRFDQSSSKAIVIAGVENLGINTGNFVADFRPYDPKTEYLKEGSGFSIGDKGGWSFFQGRHYFVVEAEPGDYVLHHTNSFIFSGFNRGNLTQLYCDKSFRFSLESGKVHYIGNYSAIVQINQKPTFLGFRTQEATDALSAYKNIEVPLNEITTKSASYRVKNGAYCEE